MLQKKLSGVSLGYGQPVIKSKKVYLLVHLIAGWNTGSYDNVVHHGLQKNSGHPFSFIDI